MSSVIVRRFGCILGCVVIAVSAAAAAGVLRAAEPEPPAEVKTLAKEWVEAKRLGDAKLIGGYLADTFVGVGPLGAAEDKRAFVRRLADPKLKVTELGSREQSLRSHGDVVVITGLYDVKGSSGEQDIGGVYRYVDVARRSGDRWVVITSTLTKVATPPGEPGAPPK